VLVKINSLNTCRGACNVTGITNTYTISRRIN